MVTKTESGKAESAKKKNDIIKEKHSSTYYFEKLYKMDSRFQKPQKKSMMTFNVTEWETKSGWQRMRLASPSPTL